MLFNIELWYVVVVRSVKSLLSNPARGGSEILISTLELGFSSLCSVLCGLWR